MDRTCNCNGCNRCATCPGQYLCNCLKITEAEVVAAVTSLQLSTVQEVRHHTGAGDGCTACHRRIQLVLAQHGYSASSPYICSVK